MDWHARKERLHSCCARAAAMQSFFRDNPEAHRYVSSQGIRELRAGGHIIQKIIANGRGIFLAILSFRVSWTLHLR